ncbi:MAG: DEAD/DEAH box helicase, partial [Candidatus Hydrogenedentes bacterium]|nr:DEAD/DEAH box helicase [Candidatus Hydrogenedentota bacterium]
MKIPVPKIKLIESITDALKKTKDGPVEVVGPWGSAKSLIAAQVSEAISTPILCIAQGRVEAEAIHDDLATFLGEERALLLPAWETRPSDVRDPADDIIAERLDTLERLAKAVEAKSPVCAVIPVRSLLQLVVPRKQLQDRTLTLEVGKEYQLDELLAQLIKMGYERDVMVEGRGQMSVRGGIFDLFPISSELPYRIEFFGDEIESIRRFEPETQRSVDHVDAIRVLPRSEKALLKEEHKGRGLTPVTDYFPKDTLIVIDEPLAVREEAKNIAKQFHESPYFMSLDTIEQRLEKHKHLTLAQVPHDKAPGATRITATTQAVSSFVGKIDGFWDQLKEWDAAEFTVVLLCINSGERRRLYELLEERGYQIGQDRFDLRIDIGRLRAGFVSPLDKLAVLSEKEMFGRHYIRRKRRRFEAGSTIVQFGDLKVGDYIVHEHHGIGRYQGLRRFEGKPGDFMMVTYTGGDTLYVPVSHIDQIQKYVGGDGATPKMDRIGGASWARTKAKVKKAVRDMTEELVKLYAARETGEGHAFMPDTPWQQEFEDAFPYDETPDQLRAIQEVKADMQKAQPMDRLLCGDVGYGKTEVALRAAFKAVQDGKQVAILAPTTVLVQQHYNTFRERLADYPIRVVSLSRFHSQKENRLAIQQLNSGEADIVIGTHRLLSKDVKFKDLGLLVVDEEQRFGVGHKERIKQLRTHVDVLTMSATPIPRTLNFSLIGIRDMSLINTAPN